MEFWLSWQNNKEQLRLPVLPEEFEVTVENLNTRVNINELGDINLIGKSGLKEMTIERFFPNQNYPFLEYNNPPKPYECVEMIERWRESGKPIRLIITGTPINLAMGIENFAYAERDGTGDVYYVLELAEYVFTETKETTTKTDSKGYKKETKRPESKEPPNDYVVKSGDTLWNIAKKLTGNGANYKKIAKKNNIKNPNLIHPGDEIVL